MKYTTLLLLITILFPASGYAEQTVFGDRFTAGTLEAYFENPQAIARHASLKRMPDVEGHVLQTTGQVAFKPVPVDENTRYALTFQVKQQGCEPIEDNSRLAHAVFHGASFMPRADLHFFDKQGNKIPGESQRHMLPFGQWQQYRWVFYPPTGAVQMQWVANSNGKNVTLYLADVSLDPVKNVEAFNINPSFTLGSTNRSGWKNGSLHIDAAGEVMLNTGYYGISHSFPLAEPGTYRLYLKASSFGRYNELFVIFLDAQGKEVSRFGKRPERTRKEWLANLPEPKEHEIFFTLPEGAVRAYFLVYQSLIQEIALTRVGDEQAYRKHVTE